MSNLSEGDIFILLSKGTFFRDLTQEHHKQQGALSVFGIFQPRSRLVTLIDEAMQETKNLQSK